MLAPLTLRSRSACRGNHTLRPKELRPSGAQKPAYPGVIDRTVSVIHPSRVAKDNTPRDKTTLDCKEVLAVTEEHLQSLERLFHDAGLAIIAIRAQLSNHETREFDSLEGLSRYDNFASRAIQQIEIIAQDEDRRVQAQLTLGGRQNRSNLWGNIYGDVKIGERLAKDIRELFLNVRPWYAWLVQANYFLVFGILGGLLVITSYVILCFHGLPPFNWRVIYFVFLYLCLALGWAFVLDLSSWDLRTVLFPRTAFLIGAGKQRHRNGDVFRQLVLGCILPLVLTAAYAVIAFFRDAARS